MNAAGICSDDKMIRPFELVGLAFRLTNSYLKLFFFIFIEMFLSDT